MEFLVEFEINVPEGTSESELQERNSAEASAAATLIDEGHLVRVWKLSISPKVLGLYRADSRTQLDGLLGGLPLYDWMTIAVTPLQPHPSDPAAVKATAWSDYLVTMTTSVPDGTTEQAVDDIRAREAAHSRELAKQGHLLRLWRPPLQPGEWRSLGLFSAEDPSQLEEVLASMPLRVWRSDVVTPLLPHPNDPR